MLVSVYGKQTVQVKTRVDDGLTAMQCFNEYRPATHTHTPECTQIPYIHRGLQQQVYCCRYWSVGYVGRAWRFVPFGGSSISVNCKSIVNIIIKILTKSMNGWRHRKWILKFRLHKSEFNTHIIYRRQRMHFLNMKFHNFINKKLS